MKQFFSIRLCDFQETKQLFLQLLMKRTSTAASKEIQCWLSSCCMLYKLRAPSSLFNPIKIQFSLAFLSRVEGERVCVWREERGTRLVKGSTHFSSFKSFKIGNQAQLLVQHCTFGPVRASFLPLTVEREEYIAFFVAHISTDCLSRPLP